MQRRSFLTGGLGSIAFALSAPSRALANTLPFSSDVTGRGPLGDSVVAALKGNLSGEIFLPGSDAYEKRRKGFAAKVNLHPALIVHAINRVGVGATIALHKRSMSLSPSAAVGTATRGTTPAMAAWFLIFPA